MKWYPKPKENLQNIIPVKSEEYDFGLDEEIADFVLMCTVLHEVDDKPRLTCRSNPHLPQRRNYCSH